MPDPIRRSGNRCPALIHVRADSSLDSLPADDRERITAKLTTIAKADRPLTEFDITKLGACDELGIALFRLRVGEYRCIVLHDSNQLVVLRIAGRASAYQDLDTVIRRAEDYIRAQRGVPAATTGRSGHS